jgi:hypothetical protein
VRHAQWPRSWRNSRWWLGSHGNLKEVTGPAGSIQTLPHIRIPTPPLRTAPERAQSQTATKAKQYVLILAQPACMRESHAIEQNSQ